MTVRIEYLDENTARFCIAKSRFLIMNCTLFLLPHAFPIEQCRHRCRDDPSNRPCEPYTDIAPFFREDECQHDTQYQIRECRDHKPSHRTCTSQDRIRSEFRSDEYEEWRDDHQKVCAAFVILCE